MSTSSHHTPIREQSQRLSDSGACAEAAVSSRTAAYTAGEKAGCATWRAHAAPIAWAACSGGIWWVLAVSPRQRSPELVHVRVAAERGAGRRTAYSMTFDVLARCFATTRETTRRPTADGALGRASQLLAKDAPAIYHALRAFLAMEASPQPCSTLLVNLDAGSTQRVALLHAAPGQLVGELGLGQLIGDTPAEGGL
jgi:hypothetical protein